MIVKQRAVGLACNTCVEHCYFRMAGFKHYQTLIFFTTIYVVVIVLTIMSSSRRGKGAGIILMLEGSHARICYDEQQSVLFSISENLAPSTRSLPVRVFTLDPVDRTSNPRVLCP